MFCILRYFVYFLPLITGTFNGDLIGKRQDVQVLDLFKKSTKRHGGAEWGEDIFSTKKACGAGFPLIQVGEEMVMPGFENTESVEI